MPESGGNVDGQKQESPSPEASPSVHDVFVSYASQDAAIANAVVENLEQHGIECWIAPRDVTPGSQYADEIVGAINNAKVLVLVLSEHAIASPHVGREIERAASKRRGIIGLRTDAAPMTRSFEYFLSESQWIDVVALGMLAALTKLTQAVRQRLAPSSWLSPGLGTDVRDPADRKRRPSYLTIKRVIAAAVLLVIASLVVGVIVRYWPSKQGGPQPPVVAAISDKSVAVLPFVDMSEKRDQEYFSDGMSEELIDMLTKLPDLRVPARTSSFYFKGKSITIPDIAKALGVAYVLEGSVRKSGKVLRVAVQLIKASNGYHVWSETYERKLDDVFKMQDEIAGAVIKALKVSLLSGGAPMAQLTTSREAYDLYLQARALINRDTSDDTLTAYSDLQRAVTLDPGFVLAWASLADILSSTYVEWYRVFPHRTSSAPVDTDPLRDWSSILTQVRTAAHAAAQQAIGFSPELAEAHLAMGQVPSRLDYDWAAADAQLTIARGLEPGNARISLEAADVLIDLGRNEEGLQLAQRAATQDPLGRAEFILAWGEYVSGSLDEAMAALDRYVQLYPKASRVHYRKGLVLIAQSKPEEALLEFEGESLSRYRESGLPLALDALGRHADADQATEVAARKDGNAMAYQLAYIYARRADLQKTFYWLERAYQQGDPGMRQLKVDPMFKNIHGEQRYTQLLQKMRLL
jgi:TolB-like protein/tetratricopeptide (TPR) repeat protein